MKLSNRVKKLEDRKSNNRTRCIVYSGKINEDVEWAKHLSAHPEDEGRKHFFWEVGGDFVKKGEVFVMPDMTHEETLEYLECCQ